MYNDTVLKVLHVFNEVQMTVAVLFGMFMQFFIGTTKTWRVACYIFCSSLFVAWYIVFPIVEMMDIEQSGRIAVSMGAISSLISTEIIAILIKVAPKAFRQKLVKYLGLKDDIE